MAKRKSAVCVQCGAARWPDSRSVHLMCRSCANSASRAKRSYPQVPCSMDGCPNKHLAQGFCRKHYYQAMRAAGVGWAKGDGGHAARARRHGVPYEAIDRQTVFERDGWRCGICFEEVSAEHAYPHPLSPSLDHVIPISAGGPHLYWNVQTAHLWCNVMKGDR